MQIIIPMAGYGTRLRPHTFTRPKPLINVAGKPMLKYILDALAQIKIDEYIFIVGHMGDQIEEYIRSTADLKAHFVTQHELIGQSHAIYLAREHIRGEVIVLFADTLFETDLSVIEKTDADGIAFIKEVEDPRRFGVVELDQHGHITRFIEKPETMENRQAVIGFYYIRDSAAMLKAIEAQITEKQMFKNEYFLTDAFQRMVDDGAKFRTQPVDVWLDCGKPETVLETNHYLLEHGRDMSVKFSHQGVAVIPPVNIHPTAQIEHAVIGPHVTIGANCIISQSIIRDSIVDAGAEVRDMLLFKSLIGQRARVTGHLQIVNIGDESAIDNAGHKE